MGLLAALSALLLPVFSRAKFRTTQASCLNNLKQINLAVRMYADDFQDKVVAPPGFYASIEEWYRYKELVKSYVGRSGRPSASDKLFSARTSRTLCARREGENGFSRNAKPSSRIPWCAKASSV